MNVIGHQGTSNEIEAPPEAPPEIGACDTVLERPGASRGARDEVQQREFGHACIVRRGADKHICTEGLARPSSPDASGRRADDGMTMA
ncbi:MAG: hypothetical protein M9885_10395 [Burkholderiaceae bacterium]|nr:hypothetical protein [Burkholderiaceae bacterium]